MHDIDSMSVNIAISTMLSMKQDKKKYDVDPMSMNVAMWTM